MNPIEIEIDVIKDADNPQTCTTVALQVDTQLPVKKCVLLFAHKCSTQIQAELLTRHIADLLADSIEQAHRRAYELGWADAKARRRKRIEFAVGFTGGQVAW